MDQQLQKALKERKNPFTNYNHISTVEVGMDYAVTELDIHPESLNPLGMVHGGCLYTLADNACGTAIHTDGRHYVTQSGNLHFVANQGQGVVQAKAVVRHRGKSTGVLSVEITNEENRLLATGEYAFYCLDGRLPTV